ncbi:MAG: hypothetical protein A3J76_02025 [Candidatus Moranbacteria bacterium RBG_13_45_13]|nr:MAG: hypothetical protein A3J76_02025 [Candidatus Moranbacteria bacterium RBG_13_45_13]
MKNYFLFVFCFLAVVFQLSVLGNFFDAKRLPDLVLIFSLTLILSLGFERSMVWLVVAGLLLDAGSNWRLGTTSLALVMLGMGLERILRFAEIRSRRFLFVLLFGIIIAFSKIVFDLASQMIFWMTAYYKKQPAGIQAAFFSQDYFLKIFYTILIGYFTYYIFRKLSRKLFAPQPIVPKR